MRDIVDSINRNLTPVIEEKSEIIEEENINDIEKVFDDVVDEIEIKEDNNKKENNSISYWRRRK